MHTNQRAERKRAMWGDIGLSFIIIFKKQDTPALHLFGLVKSSSGGQEDK